MTTPLDTAFHSMMSDEEDEAGRAAYYGQFATSELFVLIKDDAGDVFEPQLIEMDGNVYALSFDTEGRMGEFCDEPTPYLSLSGRALVQALDDPSVGIGLNLGVADTAMLLPPEALDWVRSRTGAEINIEQGKIREISSPTLVDIRVLRAIDARLATYAGVNRNAYLVLAKYQQDEAHLIILDGIEEDERASIAGALAETFRFLSPDLALDTMFTEPASEILKSAKMVGLRFDMSLPDVKTVGSTAPGMDPSKPPKLH